MSYVLSDEFKERGFASCDGCKHLRERNAKLVAALEALEKELDSGRIDLETTLGVVRKALTNQQSTEKP